MPTPRQGEDRSDFMARCVPELVEDEGVPQRQAVARCFSLWNDRNKAGGHPMNRATQKVRFEDLPASVKDARSDLSGAGGVEFKALPMTEVKVDRKKRRVEGWAAAYGNVDLGGDRIHPGAAQKTIEDRMPRQLIKFFWNHEFGIGMPEALEEHPTGLLAVGKVTDHPEFDKYLAQIEQRADRAGRRGASVDRLLGGEGRVQRGGRRAHPRDQGIQAIRVGSGLLADERARRDHRRQGRARAARPRLTGGVAA
jgi:hypothetical protein